MRKGFTDGIALGAFLTLLVLFIFAALFHLQLFGTNHDTYIQTLITSIATAATGYLAIRGIREQIQKNAEAEEQRRQESLRAARATLPLALAEVVETSRSILKAIFAGQLEPAEKHLQSLTLSGLIETLTKCIQYSDNQSGDRLAQIIRYIQVLRARFDKKYFKSAIPENECDWVKVGHGRLDYAIGWAVLDALCTSAFSYARGSKEQIPARIEKEAVYGAFVTALLLPEQHPRLVELIETRWTADRLEMKFED
jgi:hypothetical protein